MNSILKCVYKGINITCLTWTKVIFLCEVYKPRENNYSSIHLVKMTEEKESK